MHLKQWKLAILGAMLAGIATVAATPAFAAGTCTTVASGLESPLSLVQSNTGSFIVSESGTGAPNSGRISIVDANGGRHTLIDGLPAGISDVGDPSGPSGLFLRGPRSTPRWVSATSGSSGTTRVARPCPAAIFRTPTGRRRRS